MLIKFTHNGMFKDGEIVIDGLTVICGDNNTGKSCVAYNTYQYLKDSEVCFLTMDSRISYFSRGDIVHVFIDNESIAHNNPEMFNVIERILGGRSYVNLEPYMFSLGEDKFRFNMNTYSGGMNAVAPIYMYLKYFARKGQVFIIDEPEMNLHPNNQRMMARLLAMMVNSGIKVLVTTNSDYIIRELNILIMLKVVKGAAKEYGYSKKEILNPKKVKCYVTENGKLTPMDVSSKYGIEVTSFDKTIEEVNKIQQSLQYAMR